MLLKKLALFALTVFAVSSYAGIPNVSCSLRSNKLDAEGMGRNEKKAPEDVIATTGAGNSSSVRNAKLTAKLEEICAVPAKESSNDVDHHLNGTAAPCPGIYNLTITITNGTSESETTVVVSDKDGFQRYNTTLKVGNKQAIVQCLLNSF